ncbi:hypothetical protein SDC9_136223 [bioreactor metagenome]|uniref:Uncharacterized protein n=1 Tax=bioreactor metagenome TaxID=1076179 RepID=A0A645DIQ1_9ZZZZ
MLREQTSQAQWVNVHKENEFHFYGVLVEEPHGKIRVHTVPEVRQVFERTSASKRATQHPVRFL